MNFMATNFYSVFDPFFTFHNNPAIAGSINTSGSINEELMELAWNMHKTEPHESAGIRAEVAGIPEVLQ